MREAKKTNSWFSMTGNNQSAELAALEKIGIKQHTLNEAIQAVGVEKEKVIEYLIHYFEARLKKLDTKYSM